MSLKGCLTGIVVIAFVYGLTAVLTPKILFWRAMSLYEANEYPKALEYMRKTLFLKPSNPDYRYYYVKTLGEIKPEYKVQKTMYRIAHDKKNDSAQHLAYEKILEWQRNIRENIGNNYIEQAPSDTNIIRWNKNSFPLKVYVDKSNEGNLPQYYFSAISRALNQWDISVDFVDFINTGEKSEAQILILIDKLPENICSGNVCKYVVGYTTPQISRNRLKNMSITIYDKNPAGEYFSDKEIYNTVLHELGHALGIMGHSYSTGDLMYQQAKETSIYTPYREDFHYLSGRDVNTLNLLYMLEPTITDKPYADNKNLIYTPIILGSKEELALKKIEESKDYIKQSPEISAGYINLAGAYADIKQFKKAITALNSALDYANTDDEKFIIYYNFAYVYLNMKKYDAAMEYANLAGKIQTPPDLIELMGIIQHNRSISD